jgi:hypothetical protein
MSENSSSFVLIILFAIVTGVLAYFFLFRTGNIIDIILAVAAGLFAVVLTGGGGDAVLLFGGAVAGGLVWSRLTVPMAPWGREGLLPAAGGGAAVGALVLIGYTRELVVAAEFLVGVVAVAGVLALPAVVERMQ